MSRAGGGGLRSVVDGCAKSSASGVQYMHEGADKGPPLTELASGLPASACARAAPCYIMPPLSARLRASPVTRPRPVRPSPSTAQLSLLTTRPCPRPPAPGRRSSCTARSWTPSRRTTTTTSPCAPMCPSGARWCPCQWPTRARCCPRGNPSCRRAPPSPSERSSSRRRGARTPCEALRAGGARAVHSRAAGGRGRRMQ